MLSLANRTAYTTLLDAITLNGGDQPAITFVATDADPIVITRTHFRETVLQYGALLAQQGIVSGDMVIIAHPDIVTSIYAFWGALAIGAMPSMFPTRTEKLDIDIYTQNLSQLVTRSNVKAIVTSDSSATQLPLMPCPIIRPSMLYLPALAVPIIQPSAESIAFLQHSSGTTGLQKGVALSHQAVLNQLASYSDAINLNAHDVIISWLPLYHDMGLIAGFLLPLMQGIPLILMSPFDWIAHPALLLNSIDRYNGTLCWLPNFAYNHMARRIRKRDSDGLSLATMRAFINCSEPVRHDSHNQFLKRFADTQITQQHLTVCYAMAENTFAVTQTPTGQVAHIDTIDQAILENNQIAKPSTDGLHIVSCGYVLKHTQIRIVDDHANPLDERHVGEVLISSDCMLTHYHQRPDLQPFTIDGWYRTGDMGYIANQQLYIIGRKKDIIITSGKNIYPQDIEAIVNRVEGVHIGRSVVFGVMDARDGTERIAVVVELDNETQIDEQTLKKKIRQVIGQQTTVSASFVSLVPDKWLIKTSSGKIARAANYQKWLKEFGTLLQ